jgi:hypothetical protein
LGAVAYLYHFQAVAASEKGSFAAIWKIGKVVGKDKISYPGLF